MLSKSLPVLLVVYFLSDFSFALRNDKSIAEDYKHVEGLPGLYKFHETKKSWRDAKQACIDEDASLFYPRNSIEANAGISFGKLNSSSSWMYVGIDKDKGAVFKTVDGKPISEAYINWVPNQPDNHNNNEDCVHMNGGGRLNDVGCSKRYSFMCEKKLAALRSDKSIAEDYKYVEGLPGLYKFHKTQKNWHDAKQACIDEDASLFYPRNSTEANAAISFGKLNSNSSWMYMGIVRDKEAVFKTVDGKLMSEAYNNWVPNQPDNHNNNEDCVHMNGDGRFNDVGCSKRYSFMCEKKLGVWSVLIILCYISP